MAEDQFDKTEAEYFRLRGQLAAKRMSKQQFEAALKQLVFQDVQGRSWMLGADSGKWYMHNGKTWVEADPYAPLHDAPHSAASVTPAKSRGSRRLVLLGAGCGCLLCTVVAVGLAVALATGLLKIDTRGATKVTPLPGIGYVLPTPTVRFEILSVATLPPLVVRTPTSVAPPVTVMTNTPQLSIPTPTATVKATATNTREPSTPTPVVGPGVYVTGLRLDPPSPKRREDVTFYPMFLNATGSEQRYPWLVYIYRSDNLRRSFGETAKSTEPIPVGAGELKANGGWKLTGAECENFTARVAWINQDNQPVPLGNPDSQTYELPFSVCP